MTDHEQAPLGSTHSRRKSVRQCFPNNFCSVGGERLTELTKRRTAGECHRCQRLAENDYRKPHSIMGKLARCGTKYPKDRLSLRSRSCGQPRELAILSASRLAPTDYIVR